MAAMVGLLGGLGRMAAIVDLLGLFYSSYRLTGRAAAPRSPGVDRHYFVSDSDSNRRAEVLIRTVKP